MFLIFCLIACTEESKLEENGLTKEEMAVESMLTIDWDDLIPKQYSPGKVMAMYEPELERLERLGDEEYMQESEELYKKIETEINNIPPNGALNNKWIKLAGFIAPLNNYNGLITEFLFVPYFGACIHVPPPPANQTVLVEVAPENGIRPEDAFNIFLVSGQIRITANKTGIGEANYSIKDAMIEIYEE